MAEEYLLDIMVGPRLECIAGDDAFLNYFFRCGMCGTIVIEDHRECRKVNPDICPVCTPQEKYPFPYVTSDEIDSYRVDGFRLSDRLDEKFFE